jgi:hypothetical protein
MSSKIIQIVTVGKLTPSLTLSPAGMGSMNNILNSGLLFMNPAKVVAGTEPYFVETAKFLGRKIDWQTEACESGVFPVPFALLKDAKNTEFCGIVKGLHDMIIDDLPDKSLVIIDYATVNFSRYPSVKRDFSPGTLIEIKISKDESHVEDGYSILYPQSESTALVA